MKTSLTEHVLANLVSMSAIVRRGLPVLLLYGGTDPSILPKFVDCKNYHVLPAPDRATAERTRDVLQSRGWRNYYAPEQLAGCSISLTPPDGSCARFNLETSEVPAREGPLDAVSNGLSQDFAPEVDRQGGASTAHSESIVEHFDGFVDRVEGSTAYVTLKSREHGDVMYGQYPVALLKSRGVEEETGFICMTVSTQETTRVEIEALPTVVITKEQLRAIDEVIERTLPSGDTIDY